MSALSSATRTRPRVLSVAGAGRPAGASGVGSSASVESAPSGSQRSASATKDSASGEGSRGSVVVSSVDSAPAVEATISIRCARPNGIVTVIVVPTPGSLVAWTSPSCSPTSSRTSARPMPLPSPERAPGLSTRWKRSNRRGSSSAGTPTPVSSTCRTAASAVASTRDRDPSGGGELQGVGEQVEHDLLPRVPVEQDRPAHRRAVDDVVEARARHRGREHRRELRGGRAEVDRHGVGLAAAGLEPREVEQAVDHPPEALPVAVHHLELGAPALGVHLGRGAQLGDRAHDQGQRGAELVADVGEEVGLRAVELGERLGAAPFGLVAARVGEARRDLAAEQLQEARGALVELPVGVDARDEDPGDPVALGARRRRERHEHRLRGRPVPRPAGQVAVDPGAQALDEHRLARPHPVQRPGAGPGLDHLGRDRGAAGRARARRQPRGPGVVVEQVDEAERQVAVGVDQRALDRAEHLVLGAGAAHRGGEIAHGRHLPVADDTVRVLGDHAEHSADGAVGRRRAGCRRRCGTSPRDNRCAPGRAAGPRPRSRRPSRAPTRCAARCPARSPTT